MKREPENLKYFTKEETKKMKTLQKKVKLAGMLFGHGMKATFSDEQEMNALIGIGVTVGLSQGLKYNGSVKRGVKAGLTTAGVFVVMNGAGTVVKNRHLFKEVK